MKKHLKVSPIMDTAGGVMDVEAACGRTIPNEQINERVAWSVGDVTCEACRRSDSFWLSGG